MLLVLAVAGGPLLWAACTTGNPASTSCSLFDGKLSKEDCQDLEQEIFHAKVAVEKTGLGCSQDEDCTTVIDGLCGYGGCPGPLAKTALPAYNREVGRVEATACPAWSAGGCLHSSPAGMGSCAYYTATCEKGRCEGRGH
jgi:hypothetical protein